MDRSHGGAVGLVEVAVGFEFGDALVDESACRYLVLVGEHVEVGAELVQALLDVVEHQLDAGGAERLEPLRVGQSIDAGDRGDDLGGDVVDVLAGVAVLRRRLVAGGGVERPGDRSICAPWSLK